MNKTVTHLKQLKTDIEEACKEILTLVENEIIEPDEFFISVLNYAGIKYSELSPTERVVVINTINKHRPEERV